MAVTDTMGFPLRVVGWIGGASLRSSVAAVNSARRPTLAANLWRQLYFQTSRRSTSSQGSCAVKPGIHPAYHRATVQCACGNSRSEEHTSELQSQSNIVCRLLLEKKKEQPSTFASHT